jgi:hypothetical protein
MARSKRTGPLSEDQVRKIIAEMPSKSFVNEHGEEFTIYSNGISVYMSGSEVDMMVDNKHVFAGVIPLFNNHFNIWSDDELYKLGVALAELHAPINREEP